MLRSRKLPLLAALAALVLQIGPAAAEQICTWGQPGYRSCVEAKIARVREAEAKQAPAAAPAPKGTGHKTAPAKNRPGTLTPLPSPSAPMGLPDMDDPAGQRGLKQGQQQFNLNQGRIRRDAAPEPIYPYPELNRIPGRICPAGGCDF